MNGDFDSGLKFWWRGWACIFSHRSLFLLAALPALLAMAFSAGFLWFIYAHLGDWVKRFIAAVVGLTPGFLYDLVYYPMVVGGGLVLFIAAIYVTFVFHMAVAVPFYSLLAGRTLEKSGRSPARGCSFTLRMFRASAVKALLMLFAGLVLFVFSFIPVLNLAAMAAALFLMAFDLMDYSLECMGMGLRQRLAYLWRERSQWAGMAAGLALTLPVPGLTLLVTPGAVVGAALIMKDPK